MCATCEVPLCTRPLMDEDGSSLTHHARWHNVRDLIAEHKTCHEDLKTGRESRKRARQDVGEDLGGGGGILDESLMKAQDVQVQV